MKTIYIGIDPSIKSTGIAILDPSTGECGYGAMSVLAVGEHLNIISTSFLEADHTRLVVAIERPPKYQRGMVTHAVANEIGARIKKLWGKAATIHFVVPQMWRKAVLGSGKAGKLEAIGYAMVVHKIKTKSSDEAEAVCLAEFARAKDIGRVEQ